MMKAIKNFMNEPFTWGGYFRLCGIVTGLYVAIVGLCVAWNDYKERKEISKATKADEN